MDALSDVSRGSDIYSSAPIFPPHPQSFNLDDILGFSEAARKRLSEEITEEKYFTTNRIFINHIDSFTGKRIVSLILNDNLRNESYPSYNDKHDFGSAKTNPSDVEISKLKISDAETSVPKVKDKLHNMSKKEINVDYTNNSSEKSNQLDTSKLTIAEYYDMMELESLESRNAFLKEKLKRFHVNHFAVAPLENESVTTNYIQDNIISGINRNCKYDIVGTFMDTSVEDFEGVILLKHNFDDPEFLKELLKCGTIIYCVHENLDQLIEAAWLLNNIINFIDESKANCNRNPKFDELPKFVLVSSFMTWALTKPLSMDEELPFIESDYRIRVPHPNYQLLFELEEQIVKAQLEQKIKSAVVVSGVPYGYEENELYPIFEKAYCYTHVPIYSQENNIIPIVHVDNLAQIIKTTIKHIGHVKIPFVFAKDPVQSNMIDISKAISSSLGTGICEFHSKEFAIIDDMVSQELFDKVTSKVYLESCYPLFREEDIPWNYKSGFTANINHIVKEFVEAKHHKPLRLIFYNVSDSGKLKNAVQGISNYYKIPFINVQHEISKYAEEILNKQAMIEGNNLLGSPEMQNIHNLKSSNLTPGLVLCDVEKCKEDVEPIINAIKNYTSNGATLSKLSDNVNIMARLLKRNPYIYQGYILNEYPQNPEEANIIFYQNNGETSNSDEITNIQNSPDLVIFYNKQTSFQKLDMLSQQTGSEKNNHRVSVVSTHHEQDLKMSTSTNLSDAVSKSLKGEPFVDTQVRTELHTNETVNIMESFFLKLGEKCKVTTVDFTDRDTEDDVFYKTLCVIKKYCYLRDPETVVPSSTSESFQCVETISDMEYPMKTNYQVSKSKPEVANRIKDEVMELEQNEVEEITLAIRSYPLISYLVNNIFPTLTNGIFKVAVQIPQDPIDFLAEYIFKNNPQGYMITIPQKKLNLDDNNFLRHKKNDVPKIDSKACLA